MSRTRGADDPKPDEPDFEGALASLEALVVRLEEGELSLEASLRTFEEGVRLVRVCSGRLEAAELRITQLEQEAEGPHERELEIDE